MMQQMCAVIEGQLLQTIFQCLSLNYYSALKFNNKPVFSSSQERNCHNIQTRNLELILAHKFKSRTQTKKALPWFEIALKFGQV